MKNFLKQFFFSLGVAFVLTQLQVFLESTYLITFLKQNLITLLVALLAINCTTLGIVLTKIRELMDRSGKMDSFLKTRREMMQSINEQIALVSASLVLLLIHDSKWAWIYLYVTDVTEVLVVACFVFGILILYDTAKSVFVLLEYPGDTKQE